MKTRIAAVALLLLLASPASAASGPFAPSPEVKALRLEIAALQLDRALALTPDQARALLPILQQAAGQVQAVRARAEAAQPALVAALTRARDELREGGAISPATQQAIREARGGVMAGAGREGKTLRQQALAILTPAQLQAMRTVKLGAGPGFPGAGSDHPAAPRDDQGAPGAGPGRGALRRVVMLGVVTSDPFLALVAARAR
jgi:hypothetical protein